MTGSDAAVPAAADQTEQLAQARSALERIVDRLIDQNPDAVAQFNEVIGTDQHAGEWLDHKLAEKTDELDQVVAEAAEPLSDDEAQLVESLKELVDKLYDENPELADLPPETVQEWIEEALAAD